LNTSLSETGEVQSVREIVSFHTGDLIAVIRSMEGLQKLR